MLWDVVQGDCQLTSSFLPLLRHRASTLASTGLCSLQLVQPHPVSSQCCPALLSLCVSMIALVFSFSFSPEDFASWPFWWCYVFPFFKAWPIHFHILHCLMVAISSCPVLAHSSLFMMTFSQKMPSILQNLFIEIVTVVYWLTLVSRPLMFKRWERCGGWGEEL